MMWRGWVAVSIGLLMSVGFAPAAAGVGVAASAAAPAFAHVDLASAYVGPSLGAVAGPGIAPGTCPEPGFYLQCYTPQEIQDGYGYGGAYAAVGGYANAGLGQTIVIFDAFGDPNLTANLAVFDAVFGIPAIHLNVLCPASGFALGPCPVLDFAGPNGSNEAGWTQEITLDTEYAHAMAPAATIDLVVAQNNSDGAFATAELYALAHHLGTVWSQSFGTPECSFVPGLSTPWFFENNLIYALAALQGVTIFASAGDLGAMNGCPAPSANYPADNPFNIAVAGTYLDLNFAAGANVSSPLVGAPASYGHETAWNDFENGTLASLGLIFGVTGGAPSAYFPRPSSLTQGPVVPYVCSGYVPSSCTAGTPYRASGKVAADVAYDAGVNGGVLGYYNVTYPNGTPILPPGFYIFGGTSAGAPQWAAIAAIADQLHHHALGDFAPILYRMVGSARLHDVTVGSNALEPGVGFLATRGWDATTGVGSPNVGLLVGAL